MVAMPRLVSFASPYDEIVGFSNFGLFFFRDSKASEYGILHPFIPSIKDYGRFDTQSDFHSTVLTDPYFVGCYLRPDDLAALSSSVGELGDEDIYIPQPYPHMGGSNKLETYDKGNVLVFAEIVAQTHGM